MVVNGGRNGARNAGVLRKIAVYFRKRAKKEGTPVLRLRDAPHDVEELAERIMRMVEERRADPSATASPGPIVVEIVGGHAPRRRRRASSASAPQQEAEAVAEACEMWRQYADAVKSLEEAGQRHPKAGVVLHHKHAVEHMQGAYRILHERFGVRAARGGKAELRERMRLIVDETTLDLEDAEDVASFVDAWWRFRTMDDARVAMNRALEESRRRGDDSEETAQAACEAVIHVLRSRPMLYGAFTLVPDWLEREPSGLREGRQAAADVLSGWVRTQLKLSDWDPDESEEEEGDTKKSGLNMLRVALEDLAEDGESVPEALLRVLRPATLAEWESLRRAVKEKGPERAMSELGRRKCGPTTLRNLVEEHIRREGGQKHELERLGDLAEPVEVGDAGFEEDFAVREAARGMARDALEEAGLSRREREVFVLRELGLKTREVAERLEIGEKTVYTLHRRAVRKLDTWRERRSSA